MCQITVSNLGDDFLNREAFLILGAEGSTVHGDGWGYCFSNGETLKTYLPMYCTTNIGEILGDKKTRSAPPLLGHIRQASPKVPVCTANAHPFAIDNVYFVHNGKLTPKDEDKFSIEYEVEETDAKDGKKKKVKYNRSDSLIFFEHFMETWKGAQNTYNSEEEKFVWVLNKAMEAFYGRFAMVFLIHDKCYIVRGKTAELNIAYRLNSNRKDAQVHQ